MILRITSEFPFTALTKLTFVMETSCDFFEVKVKLSHYTPWWQMGGEEV
jgi:hypothetical protein